MSVFERNSLNKAVIIDDAYDAVPTAEDLANHRQELYSFLEDIEESDSDLLIEHYSSFNEQDWDELIDSNDFISILYSLKDQLKSSFALEIFEDFDSTRRHDLTILSKIQKDLESLGLLVTTAGRNVSLTEADADIIIIDLFLTQRQGSDDYAKSASILKNHLKECSPKPPIVILTSRSPRVDHLKESFRDEAGVSESLFRIVKKSEILQGDKLQRKLRRLATHYGDAQRLVDFINSWSCAIDDSRKQIVELLRKLDLTDFAQLQKLLLVKENAPLGSYLVDLFDHVAQYHIESNEALSRSANQLNEIVIEKYPPPYISGKRETQSFVHKYLSQGPNRLCLPNSASVSYQFGDLFFRSQETPLASSKNKSVITSIKPDEALLLLTPPCDLMRETPNYLLLILGNISRITPSTPQRSFKPRTHAFYHNEIFYSIEWDVKSPLSVTTEALDYALSDGVISKVARLRAHHTAEIQQRLLSDIGRSGLAAPMLKTFSVSLAVYYPNTEGKLTALRIEHPEGSAAMHIASEKSHRLTLSEDACDSIYSALCALEDNRIHPSSRSMYGALRNSESLLLSLEKGLDFKWMEQDKPQIVPIAEMIKVALFVNCHNIDGLVIQRGAISDRSIVFCLTEEH
ncbi:hypothetical protein [Pelagicoccus sp. SDUM812003]|uniref:hypothetical protein n=1 Tax=Pelagicoccus sp. SDUM812003 TaxID=3041267 RepID=UPI00280E6DB8|nr:hypothetical protein [Pelagicoccus sp. SDUM812003]MDQ8203342.1 hypothetical protein [Pelagicoccus sp. SDUM812003]